MNRRLVGGGGFDLYSLTCCGGVAGGVPLEVARPPAEVQLQTDDGPLVAVPVDDVGEDFGLVRVTGAVSFGVRAVIREQDDAVVELWARLLGG